MLCGAGGPFLGNVDSHRVRGDHGDFRGVILT